MTAMPAPFIAPSRNRNAWQTLVILEGGFEWPSPGVVQIVNGPDTEDEYDIKEAQAQRGATTERKSQKVQMFDSVHWLSDEPPPPGTYAPVEGVDIVDDHVQWTAWHWVVNQARLATPPKALSLSHPKLAFQNVAAAVPKKIVGPDPAEDGSTVFTISWLVYAPVVKTGGDKDAPEKKTETDEDIDRELEEYKRLQEEWEEL